MRGVEKRSIKSLVYGRPHSSATPFLQHILQPHPQSLAPTVRAPRTFPPLGSPTCLFHPPTRWSVRQGGGGGPVASNEFARPPLGGNRTRGKGERGAIEPEQTVRSRGETEKATLYAPLLPPPPWWLRSFEQLEVLVSLSVSAVAPCRYGVWMLRLFVFRAARSTRETCLVPNGDLAPNGPI